MVKPLRSPLLGYNHNVKYRGRIFHVQTEDSGPAHPRLFTHLYFHGTILATKRHDYDESAAENTVRALMQGQHKAILKELKQAVYDERLAAFFAARNEPFSLEEALTTPPPDSVRMPTPAPEVIAALDLDALPPVIPDEALPASVSGPGVYIVHGGVREQVYAEDPPTQPNPIAPPVGPPPQPHPGYKRHHTQPMTPLTPSVQRQVVVGVGGSGPNPTGPRPRRPAQSIPYVVKEGSHPTLHQPRTPVPQAVPPPRPMVPPPAPSANAPRTTASQMPASPPADLISDKSLDEVILAYLSQGDSGPQR